jgi:predicted dehydrogenase
MNPEVSQAALAAGCHVIAEKPIAARLADAEEMVRRAAGADRILMIAENYRYEPAYRRAAELVAEGVIGRAQLGRWLLFSTIAPDSPYYESPWRQQPEHPGGYISDGGVHHMAVLRMILGEAEVVSAEVAGLRPDLPPADTVTGTIRFANGALGTYANTWALAGPDSPLQIAGTEGILLAWRNRVELWQNGAVVRTSDESSPVSGLDAMYQDFARAIRTGQPPRSTPAEALADFRLILAMLRSSETGKMVRVAEGAS